MKDKFLVSEELKQRTLEKCRTSDKKKGFYSRPIMAIAILCLAMGTVYMVNKPKSVQYEMSQDKSTGNELTTEKMDIAMIPFSKIFEVKNGTLSVMSYAELYSPTMSSLIGLPLEVRYDGPESVMIKVEPSWGNFVNEKSGEKVAPQEVESGDSVQGEEGMSTPSYEGTAGDTPVSSPPLQSTPDNLYFAFWQVGTGDTPDSIVVTIKVQKKETEEILIEEQIEIYPKDKGYSFVK